MLCRAMVSTSAVVKHQHERFEMGTPIALSEPTPTLLRGLIGVLADAGFSPEVPRDIVTWATQPGARAVVVDLAGRTSLELIGRLRDIGPALPIVALLSDTDPASYEAALVGGASAAVSAEVAPEELVHVIEDALGHHTLLSVEVAHEMAARAAEHDPPTMTEREIEWLRALAHGESVVALASYYDYSRRAFHRLLGELYARMKVANRAEAIAEAARQGVLE